MIPNSVTSIGWEAFYGCSSLTSVTIGNGVTIIGGMAFCSCYSLTSVTIGDGVTSIGRDAFYGTAYYNDEANWDSGILYLGSWILKARVDITTAEIHLGTKGIADDAFRGCRSLTSVEIPASVTSIGDSAFQYCEFLTSVEIPNSVTSIGDSAFNSCSSLTSVTIGNGVTSIGWGAFWGCSSLTSVEIPGSVTSIGRSAFYGCSSLTSVEIPASVSIIGDKAFGYYYDDGDKPFTDFTICGYEGTAAQTYAEENQFKFVPLQAVNNPFEDVKESDFYFNPVLWAVSNGVTNGRSETKFAPNEKVKRSEAMTFFWRACGEPAPKITTSPFKDVKKKDWYYTPVLWAVENEITEGTSPTKFSPNKKCVRSEILKFLYSAMGKPAHSGKNPYSDVKKKHWYYDSAIWAYENGIEKGSNGKFKPKTACTRAYVVTYLYRFLTGNELVP